MYHAFYKLVVLLFKVVLFTKQRILWDKNLCTLKYKILPFQKQDARV